MPKRPPLHRPQHWKPRSELKRESETRRESAHDRGYDARWRKARNAYLAQHPLCVECAKKDFVTAANVVDHIIPHKGDKRLFWDTDNWQSLCKRHHDQKTAREGAFGNEIIEH